MQATVTSGIAGITFDSTAAAAAAAVVVVAAAITADVGAQSTSLAKICALEFLYTNESIEHK